MRVIITVLIQLIQLQGRYDMFSLNYNDTRPVYEQIKDKLKQLILTGALKTDARLPSVRELAASLAINPNTIQRAYKELEAEGYVYSVRAKGSFVAPIGTATLQRQRDSLFDELDKTLAELVVAGVCEEAVTEHIKNFYMTKKEAVTND